MISKKCKYALRAILYLATESNEQHKLNAKLLSSALKIPSPYLSKILQELAPKNIITSAKGPTGGFYLSNENLEVPLIDIIAAIDGPSYFSTCGLGLEKCSDKHPCPLHDDFKKSREHMQKVFSGKSVKQLASEMKKKDSFLVI